jgi:hypothetical protein
LCFSAQIQIRVGEPVNFAAQRMCVFAFLLIEISSRKAVPEVTSTFPGPLHHFPYQSYSYVFLAFLIRIEGQQSTVASCTGTVIYATPSVV